mgnify:CR=1 FL=1
MLDCWICFRLICMKSFFLRVCIHIGVCPGPYFRPISITAFSCISWMLILLSCACLIWLARNLSIWLCVVCTLHCAVLQKTTPDYIVIIDMLLEACFLFLPSINSSNNRISSTFNDLPFSLRSISTFSSFNCAVFSFYLLLDLAIQLYLFFPFGFFGTFWKIFFV